MHRFTSTQVLLIVAALVAFLAMTGPAAAQTETVGGFSGAIYTTGPDGATVNQNLYTKKSDVFLNGGPQGGGSGLPDGIYYYQVTTPDGDLLSTDCAWCRQLQVVGGVVFGAWEDPAHPGCSHVNGPPDVVTGAIGVQLMPYADTTNSGGEYKVWLIRKYDDAGALIATVDADCVHITFSQSKTDNFKVECSAPRITCPPDVSQSCEISIDPSTTGTVTYTGGCGTVRLTYADVDKGGCPKVIERTWTVTDEDLNTASCVQTITISDSTPPVISGEASISVQCKDDIPATAVRVTDNCDPSPFIAFVEVSDGKSCPETIVRTFTATDWCGNSSQFVQFITVDDTIAPEFASCPANVTVQCKSDLPTADPASAGVTDNCDDSPDVTVQDVSDGKSCPETITRTYTATDDCGNSSTCAQTITIDDTIAPEFTNCPQDVTVECADDVPAADPAGVGARDNCDATPEVTVNDVSDGNSCPEKITRTYTATDDCGNSSTCVQTITVDDTIAPEFTNCPEDVTVQCREDVPAADTAGVGATDNCDESPDVTVNDVSDESSCPEIITRTYTATDDCGNSSTCVQTITVDDTTAPEITCPDSVSRMSWGVPCERTFELPVEVKDNCDANPVVTYTRSDGKEITDPFPGDVKPGITTTVTVTATDACGNEATCSFGVTVVCMPYNTIGGTKYYDLNANYELDPTDPPIAGFKIEVTYTLPDGETGSQIVETDVDGTWTLQLPEGSTFRVCEILPPEGWIQMGPTPGAVVKVDDTVVATAGVSMCWTGQLGSVPILDLYFLNVCVTPATGGYTKGFWTNKNGEDVLRANDPAWRAIINSLCLRKEDGTDFDVPITGGFKAAYTPFEGWLKDARAVNMAFMLSAQLAACRLDVAYMGLNGDAKLLIPRDLLNCVSGVIAPPLTINNVIDLANTELCAHGLAGADTSWRSYQGCLETILDGINNNRWYFLPAEPCVPVYPPAPLP